MAGRAARSPAAPPKRSGRSPAIDLRAGASVFWADCLIDSNNADVPCRPHHGRTFMNGTSTACNPVGKASAGGGVQPLDASNSTLTGSVL
jgi:hypothetical protein